jgi:SAM-dependent methyltransferase
MPRSIQTAYDVGHGDASNNAPIEDRVYGATYSYLRRTLGWDDAFARERAQGELERTIPKCMLAALEAAGVRLTGKTVVDLGGGLGGLSSELAENGVDVICIEPGAAWRSIAKARLEASGRGTAVGAVGEALPLRTESVDVIISLWVLEHVEDAPRVIAEAYRILKPGGVFYFACENYLSFWEPHYRMVWLPLMPKSLGSVYLRIRGRSPRFLNESVTYVTRVGIIRSLKRAGYELARERSLRNGSASTRSWLARVILKLVHAAPPRLKENLVMAVIMARGIFSPGISEICYKP